MTQKDLAERLNVSDKTVSRWERDDGAPDLAAIPAIAEIFGVTCDELLRGERKSPEERTVVSKENETTPKGEKQRQPQQPLVRRCGRRSQRAAQQAKDNDDAGKAGHHQ
mgnify:CR=1 FL=1